ncbi:MAG: prolyl oligopeptidase family serine peptidase [Gammaproteobacteria bacterium]|nr:prolyl oligopeptidase family serine peptidase [Gammaproteobacteria bacterium]
MNDALKRAGKRVELVTERREGHGFFAQGNRTELYERLLEFFGAHLAPASNPR